VTFELNGQETMALNGGPVFQFSQAISFMVPCNTQ
jgi:predicted 3-demethylubiquinone-9 3-methyltransferase (glyoxalase superfamily)